MDDDDEDDEDDDEKAQKALRQYEQQQQDDAGEEQEDIYFNWGNCLYRQAAMYRVCRRFQSAYKLLCEGV